MNHQEISRALCATIHPVANGVSYIESPLTIHGDGQLIGLYVRDIGQNRIRISDDRAIMFNAMTHGVSSTPNKLKQLRQMALQSSIDISADGEIFSVCDATEAVHRLVDAFSIADKIGYLNDSSKPKPTSKFDMDVASALAMKFPKGLVRGKTLVGASGHQLRFPFLLSIANHKPVVVQTISARDSRLDWSQVYQSIGKLIDLKTASDKYRRAVVLQAPTKAKTKDLNQAKVALSEVAAVHEFSDAQSLASFLAA